MLIAYNGASCNGVDSIGQQPSQVRADVSLAVSQATSAIMFLPFLLVIFQWACCWNCSEAYKTGDCGIPKITITVINNGVDAGENEYPWHVAIYKLTETSEYSYICGGTIIDSDVVITAAHCVFNETAHDIDNSPMMVIAGKIYGSWHHNDPDEQRLEVIKKKVPTTYRGTETMYQDDVALLALNGSIRFSDLVMPICIESSSLHEPTGGELGVFAGWGYDANGILSEKLLVTRIQPSNLIDCNMKFEKGVINFSTSDKFCTNTVDMSTLEKGDSGGGAVFLRNFDNGKGKYYFYGVLSFRKSTTYFFTKISSNIPWINSTILQLSSKVESPVKECSKRGYRRKWRGHKF